MKPYLSRKILYQYERRGFPLVDLLLIMRMGYPSLFPKREHALEHLYCTIGNGYEWRNGRLVAPHIDPYDKEAEAIRRWRSGGTRPVADSFSPSLRRMRKERRDFQKSMSLLTESAPQQAPKKEPSKESSEVEADPLAQLREHVNNYEKEREAYYSQPLSSCYPLCEYSRMACVPDDVKLDFLAGAREMIEIVLGFDPAGGKLDYRKNDNLINMEFARRCKKDLDNRFPQTTVAKG